MKNHDVSKAAVFFAAKETPAYPKGNGLRTTGKWISPKHGQPGNGLLYLPYWPHGGTVQNDQAPYQRESNNGIEVQSGLVRGFVFRMPQSLRRYWQRSVRAIARVKTAYLRAWTIRKAHEGWWSILILLAFIVMIGFLRLYTGSTFAPID